MEIIMVCYYYRDKSLICLLVDSGVLIMEMYFFMYGDIFRIVEN